MKKLGSAALGGLLENTDEEDKRICCLLNPFTRSVFIRVLLVGADVIPKARGIEAKRIKPFGLKGEVI